jgi:hypothetical protein
VIYVTFNAPGHFGGTISAYCKDIEDAQSFAKEREYTIKCIRKSAPTRVHDGTAFQPHFNYGLGMFINDRRQYREELKKRNLVEVGNEKPMPQTAPPPPNYIDENAVRGMKEIGVNLSESEANELVSSGS